MTANSLTPIAEIGSMFAVPLAQSRHPEHEQLKAELRPLLLSRAADPRYANPRPSLQQQAGVFESEFNLFSWPEPSIQRLKTYCWTELGRTVQQVNGYSAQEMARLQIYSHTWFHVTRRDGFVIAHTHPMASWSGVYCVDPGVTPPDRPESGLLRFQNPHYYSNLFLDPGNARLLAPYHHGSWCVKFQAGQLVLFPSWVAHEVLPFFGDDERITIAFNCWFGMRDA